VEVVRRGGGPEDLEEGKHIWIKVQWSTGQSRHWLASVLACYGSMLGPPLECTTICRPVPLVHPNLFFFNTAFLPTQRSVPY